MIERLTIPIRSKWHCEAGTTASAAGDLALTIPIRSKWHCEVCADFASDYHHQLTIPIRSKWHCEVSLPGSGSRAIKVSQFQFVQNGIASSLKSQGAINDGCSQFQFVQNGIASRSRFFAFGQNHSPHNSNSFKMALRGRSP